MPRRSPPLSVKLFASAAVTVLVLGLLELGARLAGGAREPERRFGQFEEQVHVLLRRGLFVRDPELFWRLAPADGIETPIAPGGLRVNSRGLRGPEWPRAAAPGVTRIVTLGDSCTFGWRVTEAEAYPAVLGELLRGRGLRAEVINAGVPGYTSVQALRLLQLELLAYEPQAVVFYFGWNELWPARGQPDVAQAVSGRLVELENVLDRSHLYRLLRRGYVAVRSDLGERRDAGTQPRVSPEQYRQVLERLVQLCRDRGLQLALMTQPARQAPHARCWSPPQHELLAQMNAITREAAVGEGTVLVDGAALLAAEPQDETFVDCVHPSASGHRLLAAALAEALAGRLLPPGR
jgi:lysophospholipase L1-like esterase